MRTATLVGRTALVTGSSSGIGRAIALAMREAGAKVLFHSHEPGLQDLPAGCRFLQFDLSAPATPAALLEAAFKLEPELDLLVSNAGSFFDVPFLEMTPDRWEQTMALNLRAAYFAIQAFAKQLVSRRRRGSVVVVASTNAFQSELDSSAYDISKGGLVSLTRTLAVSLAADGIRVNAIAPGLIRTPLTERWLRSNHALRAHYEKNIPLGRIGLPEDCAAATVFLASDAADYITGHTLIIDGGLTAQQIGKI